MRLLGGAIKAMRCWVVQLLLKSHPGPRIAGQTRRRREGVGCGLVFESGGPGPRQGHHAPPPPPSPPAPQHLLLYGVRAPQPPAPANSCIRGADLCDERAAGGHRRRRLRLYPLPGHATLRHVPPVRLPAAGASTAQVTWPLLHVT